MNAVKVAVADDVALARTRLARILEEAGCEVLGQFEDGTSLLEWLQTKPALDLLFLDIKMPGPSGLEVAAELPYPLPVVFVTAHREHALEAYDLAALDYVLKPISEERIQKTLDRFRQGLVPARPAQDYRAALHIPRVVVRVGDGLLLVDLRKVSHFEVHEEQVWTWMGGERLLTQWKSLTEVESAFPGAGLMRINRSALVRPEAITGVRALWGGRAMVRLGSEVELEVSRSSTPALKERFGIKGDFYRKEEE